MYCSFDFVQFSDSIDWTSANTDVPGRSPEVGVNEVLLYFLYIYRSLS